MNSLIALAVTLGGLTQLPAAMIVRSWAAAPPLFAAAPPGAVNGVSWFPRWGQHGHMIAARAAVQRLPAEMPAFFREAEDQLVYLDPEPDRWRDSEEGRADAAMNEAFAPEHWVHLDEVPASAFYAQNRFDYILALDRAGLDVQDAGLLPYRILELAQRLRSGFRRWRATTDPETREWIEQRIINDAGILGHYVTDGSNPHHTSKHHDRWVGENPRGFTTEPGFHGRFESGFVAAHVTLADILAAVTPEATVFQSLRAATLEHLQSTHARLLRLYELDLARPFNAANDSPEHKDFAVERLAAGARMLRDVWWTAWVSSARSAGG